MVRGRPAAAARFLQQALTALGWSADDPPARSDQAVLTSRVLMSLALTQVELARPVAGFSLMDAAEELMPPAGRGIVLQQRGLMLVLTGRLDEALTYLDEAIGRLNRTDERLVLARTLLNRGLLHHNTGRIGLARADLTRCERMAGELGETLLVAKATHSRGHCDLHSGDIAAALRNFDSAAAVYETDTAQPLLGTISVDKARALLAVGLFAEAAVELDKAIRLFGRQGAVSRDRAEAELFRAHVALAAGDWVTARDWSLRARRRFREQGNETWAGVATLAKLRADFYNGRALASTASRAGRLASDLRGLGLGNDADAAALLSARAYIALDRRQDALTAIGHCRRTPQLEHRVQRRLVLAELAASAGERGDVLRHCRLGLAALDRRRSRFGSVDLRTATSALGVELAALGLETALAGRSVAQVFTWLERSRAQSFRALPALPAEDPQISDAVAELRYLGTSIRANELAGRHDAAARRRSAELERVIRAHGWQAGGDGRRLRGVRFAEVVAELAGSNSAMVSYAVHRGEMLAVLLTDRGGKLCRLGDAAAIFETVSRLHHDIDAQRDWELPALLERVIRDSARRHAASLADALLGPLWPAVGDRDLVVVPTGTVSAVPWSVLPGLRGRPVTVTPSALTWLRGRRAAAPPAGMPPLLVAGPDLQHARAELHTLARMYPDAVLLEGADATVAATLQQMDGRAVVHIAAHGHHEQDNVLFSRLDLADGPLMAYDVQQLPTAPAHVVLPACDIGRTVVRTGDELLGFTAALLYMGTSTVVSCVNRVLDHVAVGVMSKYHGALRTGHPPASALAEACADDGFLPFVCFGSG